MNEYNQVLNLVKTKPKHFSTIIKKTPELYSVIKDCVGETISEKVFNYLTPAQSICKYNNNKKFISINEGYKFCGNAKNCLCAKESISTKVSLSKKNYTLDKKIEIANKRKSTNLKKYGVENTGQLETAIRNHTAFYQDLDKVQQTIKKIKNTKITVYGSPTFNNSEKIKKTFKEKYTADYWAEKLDNENIKILNDFNELSNLYNSLSIVDIAEKLNVHIQTVYKYLNKHNLRDPFKSTEEKELIHFLTSLGITNIVQNTRKLLPSKREIDIFLPDYNLAIEYNGIYWHHEDVAHITRSYHNQKFKECEELGIQLITVFSNFWKLKKEIVKQIIRNKLKLTNSVYARNCTLISLKSADIKDFLNKNHIQGYTTSTYNYGLMHQNNLVAVMTFGKTRTGIGKKEDAYELIRYASSIRVAGGASKLLKHFIKTISPNKIISYSDNEWSNGNLYSALGFTLEKDIPPSYWYISPREERLMHRFNYAKHKLVKLGYDSALTERQIVKQMGLLKIWDCGKKRWVLNFKER